MKTLGMICPIMKLGEPEGNEKWNHQAKETVCALKEMD
jgi:hypothetical protein